MAAAGCGAASGKKRCSEKKETNPSFLAIFLNGEEKKKRNRQKKKDVVKKKSKYRVKCLKVVVGEIESILKIIKGNRSAFL